MSSNKTKNMPMLRFARRFSLAFNVRDRKLIKIGIDNIITISIASYWLLVFLMFPKSIHLALPDHESGSNPPVDYLTFELPIMLKGLFSHLPYFLWSLKLYSLFLLFAFLKNVLICSLYRISNGLFRHLTILSRT